MPRARPGPEPRQRRVNWARATRIVADRYPPIDLFERVSPDPAVWEGLIAAEGAVNPRLRDAVGEIRLVATEERISGPGASWVMAAFTHLNPKGSRFSDGSYAVYYAARELQTAIRETAYHFGRFATDSADRVRYENMRVLVGRIDNRFADVASLPAPLRARGLAPDSYAEDHPSGAQWRAHGAHGVISPSRAPRGVHCGE